MAQLDFTAITGASIATPAAGVLALYVDSVSKRLTTLDDAAVPRVYVDATGASRRLSMGGPVALVTGVVIVATGLATVTSFQATLSTQPTGTGTASAQILAATSITTGAVTVRGYSVSSVTGATVAATTSTGSFYWFAMGT